MSRCRAEAGRYSPLLLHLRLRSGAWVSAEAATLFTAFGVLGLANSLAALEATRRDVLSFFAITHPPYAYWISVQVTAFPP